MNATPGPRIVLTRIVLAGLMVTAAGSGCARRTTVPQTYTHESSTTTPGSVSQSTETRTTVTETHVDEDAPRGILSTTVHFIGEILSLPFRLVGGLLRAIF